MLFFVFKKINDSITEVEDRFCSHAFTTAVIYINSPNKYYIRKYMLCNARTQSLYNYTL